MSGKELQRLQNKLGVTPETVCTEAGISMTTLYKIYGDAHVRQSSKSKVTNALERLKFKLKQNTGARLVPVA